MSDHNIKIERLAEELARLVEFVPATQHERNQRYELAQSLIDSHLKSQGGLSQYAPHFLWHYLSDADIRMKDEVYAEMQNRRINLMLQYLKRGMMPSNEDI